MPDDELSGEGEQIEREMMGLTQNASGMLVGFVLKTLLFSFTIGLRVGMNRASNRLRS